MLPNEPQAIPLERFTALKDFKGRVAIVNDAEGQPTVVASGQTGTGRRVDWLDSDTLSQSELQAATDFVAALTIHYGPRIAGAVAAELALESDVPLDGESINKALCMAHTQHEVFAGANFFIELHCSAAAHAPGFRTACENAGIDFFMLQPDQLNRIDAQFQAALAIASQANREPLSPADGEVVMAALLTGHRFGAAGES